MNAQEVERTAADWLTQRVSDTWSASDQARLDAWINKSLAHRIAYIRAESVWREVGRLQVVRPGEAKRVVPPRGMSLKWVPPAYVPPRDPPSTQDKPRQVLLKSLAAAILLALIGIGFYSSGIMGAHRFTTSVGHIDTLALADGTHVTLNTDSRIHVDITQKSRRIELDRGEAFFKVAKDPTRPFFVDIEDRRVTAVGTEFSVRRDHGEIRVTVTEGAVRVDPIQGALPSADILRAGSVAHIREHAMAVEQRPVAQAEESLSWCQGYLVFRDSALADAVAEFNRYNTRKMVIADPSITALKIGGHFRATSIDVFLWMLQNGFPVVVEEGEHEVVLRGR